MEWCWRWHGTSRVLGRLRPAFCAAEASVRQSLPGSLIQGVVGCGLGVTHTTRSKVIGLYSGCGVYMPKGRLGIYMSRWPGRARASRDTVGILRHLYV